MIPTMGHSVYGIFSKWLAYLLDSPSGSLFVALSLSGGKWIPHSCDKCNILRFIRSESSECESAKHFDETDSLPSIHLDPENERF